jgi:hypothetical protein
MNWIVAGFHNGDFDNADSVKTGTLSVSQHTNQFRRILDK